jgi:hypothetical protein
VRHPLGDPAVLGEPSKVMSIARSLSFWREQ